MNTETLQTLNSVLIPASNEKIVGQFVAADEIIQENSNASPCSGSCNGSCSRR